MNELLAIFAKQMTPELRDHVAQADRGDDQEEHRAAIDALCDTLEVPACFRWVPLEVLGLVRWHNPLDPDITDWDISTRQIHIVRAFCCTALLMQSDGGYFGVDSTLGNLGASLLALDRAHLRHLPALLNHVLSTPDLSEDEIALTFVLHLWVTLELGAPFERLLKKVLATEATSREVLPAGKRRQVGFAGIKSLVAVSGWYVIAGRLQELSQHPEIKEIATRLLAMNPVSH